MNRGHIMTLPAYLHPTYIHILLGVPTPDACVLGSRIGSYLAQHCVWSIVFFVDLFVDVKFLLSPLFPFHYGWLTKRKRKELGSYHRDVH